MAIVESEGLGSGPRADDGRQAATTNDLASAAAKDQADLVERARSGDVAAFDALVAARLTPTFRLVRAILGGTEESEDTTQEAFIAAWRALPTLRRADRFDAWFGRIVVNACRMSMRRRPQTVCVPMESVADGQAALAEDPGLERLVDSDALNQAIDSLPVGERAILALYYLEDRPLSTVARILGMPTGTAKWRLWRARRALRQAMDADIGYAAPPVRLPPEELAP